MQLRSRWILLLVRTVPSQGFVPDLAHFNTATKQQWTEGVPEPSFWQGLKLSNRERIPIATYRCPRCGLLQSYAPER